MTSRQIEEAAKEERIRACERAVVEAAGLFDAWMLREFPLDYADLCQFTRGGAFASALAALREARGK
jgi:hypothetical protein